MQRCPKAFVNVWRYFSRMKNFALTILFSFILNKCLFYRRCWESGCTRGWSSPAPSTVARSRACCWSTTTPRLWPCSRITTNCRRRCVCCDDLFMLEDRHKLQEKVGLFVCFDDLFLFWVLHRNLSRPCVPFFPFPEMCLHFLIFLCNSGLLHLLLLEDRQRLQEKVFLFCF